MIIEKRLSKYVIFSEESIIKALKKISDNSSRIIFSVTDQGVLGGVLSDGDFRRWLVNQKNIDLNQPVSLISNKNFIFARDDEEVDKIKSCFSSGIELVPLLDKNYHLVAIAKKYSNEIILGNFVLTTDSPTFIIAEIGNNHNGSLKLAKELIDRAVEVGAHCVKFQMRHLQTLCRNQGYANDVREDLGSQYTLDLLNRFQLPIQDMFVAFDYCKDRGILPLCTPWDLDSLAQLEQSGLTQN